jgi:hypothetical protein
MLGVNARGLMVISPAVENGVVLSACENLEGFEGVLRRLKTNERAAYTELVFAARLVEAGFQPVLEPPLGDRFLDTRISTDAGEVYCEVISPETSDAIREVTKAASSLARRLKDQNAGSRVEVLLSVDIDDETSDRVLDAARLHANSSETWTFETTALISKRASGSDVNVGPTIPCPGEVALLGTAECSFENGVRTAGIVRLPVTDTRAKRLLYGESHHFSRDEMNILVIDVTRVISSLGVWSQLIGKCFQPGQNRRFGAVVLFSAGVGGENMAALQEWAIVRNPYAEKPIPQSVLGKLMVPNSAQIR